MTNGKGQSSGCYHNTCCQGGYNSRCPYGTSNKGGQSEYFKHEISYWFVLRFYYTRIGGIGNPLIGLVAVTDAVHGAAFFNAKTFVLALCYVELWEHTLCELLIAVITAFGHDQLGTWGQLA